MSLLLVLGLPLLGAATSQRMFHGLVSSRGHRPADRLEVIRSPLPQEYIADKELPSHFDWRNVSGVNYVASDVNQHIPTYCGSCWIHGSTAALNDRIKIARKAQFPDVMVSRQALMNCVPSYSNYSDAVSVGEPKGCNGGDAWEVYEYLHRTKVPDETCQPYEAKNGQCDDMGVCRNCFTEGCWAIEKFSGIGVAEYGNVSGETAMMKEIFARGPIACSAFTNLRFFFNYSEVASKHDGVYIDRSIKNITVNDTDHVVSVSGWGQTKAGQKYWIIRNSWGTYWGEGGWFKLLRGENHLMIESDCYWPVPAFSEEELHGQNLGNYGDAFPHRQTAQSQQLLDAVLKHATLVVALAMTAGLGIVVGAWAQRKISRSSRGTGLLAAENGGSYSPPRVAATC